MSTLLLPLGARFNCALCGECCKRWDITFSEREFAELKARDWVSLFPELAGEVLFEREKRDRWFGPRTYRFALQENKACAFLEADSGKCRMHARFGGNIKPLVCRFFPFTFTEASVGTFVGLRFNCPAVVAGSGQSLEAQREDILGLVKALRKSRPLPASGAPAATSEIFFTRRQKLWWSEIVEIESHLLRALRLGMAAPSALPRGGGDNDEPEADGDTASEAGKRQAPDHAQPDGKGDAPWGGPAKSGRELLDRILLGARLIDLLSTARLEKVRRERLAEFVALVWEGARAEHAEARKALGLDAPADSPPTGDRDAQTARPSPSRADTLVFRQFLCYFFNREYLGHHKKSFFGRFRALGFSVLKNNLRFAFGRGQLRFGDLPSPVNIRAVSAFETSELPVESAELLHRYFITKLEGKNAVGELFFDQSYVDGYYFLMVLVSTAIWFARCSALGHGRDRILHEDVVWAVRYVDSSFGSTTALGSFRERMKIYALTLPERAQTLLAAMCLPARNQPAGKDSV
ncbi:MAG: YkgJ family cysteine cluster protein [Planctomycetota bacterium]|nr:YkgJ family cysteine cluster protein [Planctomycetota bacterium]